MAINEANQKVFFKAIHEGNLGKIQNLLNSEPDLLNTNFLIKTDQVKYSRKKTNFTPLGYAIYLDQDKVVTLFLMTKGLILSAGQIWFHDPEQWAKFLKKQNIADQIAAHKAQKGTQGTVQDIESQKADIKIETEIGWEEKVYLHLKRNKFNLAVQEFSRHTLPLKSRPVNDQLVLKLIDMFLLEEKFTRWILIRNNKKETLNASRDDLLEESADKACVQKEAKKVKLKFVRDFISALCPALKAHDALNLDSHYKTCLRETGEFSADYSDDSDNEDEDSLARCEKATKRFSDFEKIERIASRDGFWTRTNRENLIKKLTILLRSANITDKNIDQITGAIFKNKRKREELTTSSEAQTKKFVAQYRGVNYMSDRWSKEARKHHYKMEEQDKPQFSESVLKTLPYNFYTDLTPDNDYHEKHADALIEAAKSAKDGYSILQNDLAPVIEESIALKCKPYVFNNTADFLQSEYTNGISQHLLQLKEYRRKNIWGLGERTLNSFNYAISTSDCPNHALRYALGLKTYYADNFAIRYNKNGALVNSHVGKAYIILQEMEEFNQPNNINHVLRAAYDGRVPINKVGGVDIAYELENDYIASIPGKNVVYQLRLKFPSFSGPYQQIFQIKYGMNKDLYDVFAELIKKTWNSDPNNSAHQTVIELLKEWLCAYYEVLLLHLAQEISSDLGGELFYVLHNGMESKTPEFVPFTPGDAHLPERNKVHVLQNFRTIVASNPELHTQNNGVDEVVDAVTSKFSELYANVTHEPSNPSGFAKISDPQSREFYQSIERDRASEGVKKMKIAVDVLNKNKSTLPSKFHIAEPLLFSRRPRVHIEEMLMEPASHPAPSLKLQN